ncbi:hypothetical protein PAXRUDRAFT_822486 [Paxillus rubicundulus Ve08.2h10]|uniref:Uncharacterized protein n=1 Tax=Paxillus rubicundulus Ve08.2h10 TaxID=930991 RepID=A0A0D0E563_9AGAM|nr:hypothetical protein PAXRUDRAFT_822486 [Paxillus rubicundulus Ve08.2h10]
MKEMTEFEFRLLSTEASPTGNGIETQQRGNKPRSPDNTSQHCSGKVITSLELQAELAGVKGIKN